MIASKLLQEAAHKLSTAGVTAPMRDARKLMRHALQDPNLSDFLDYELPVEVVLRFEAMISDRLNRKPVSKILGYREFWGQSFSVTQETLDPRPDSELIVELALQNGPFERVLDLGTGTGCLLLTLLNEMSGATGVGVDISDAALKVARENASLLGLEAAATFLQSDWFAAIEGHFDLIVCNPPYVSEQEMEQLDPEVAIWEPRVALTPGGDGLSSYRTLVYGLKRHLKAGGTAIFEIGSTQAQEVAAIFGAEGFSDLNCVRDLNDKDRAFVIST